MSNFPDDEKLDREEKACFSMFYSLTPPIVKPFTK